MPQDGGYFKDVPIRPRARYGERLEADIYDQRGILLLRAGKIVQEEHWVTRLEGRDTNSVLPTPELKITPSVPSPPSPWSEQCRAEAAVLRQDTFAATIAKQEAVKAVASVFERIIERPVDISELRSVVSAMISGLVKDPRALLSMAMIKDADNYTHTHSVNVSVLSMCLAMRVGYESDAQDIGIGGLVHDIGKVDIPPEILHKPGPLSKGEAYVMRQHPTAGAQLLANSGAFSPISILCARDHHETVNGGGYPVGKSGREICPQAQMVSIADVYDALTTDRPYRQALSPKQALILMTQKLADAFAPELLKALVGLVGFHPVGSTFTLANGFHAVVLQNDPSDPTKPALVQTTTTPDGTPVDEPLFVDLRVNPHLVGGTKRVETLANVAVPLVMRELRGFEALA